MGNNYYKRLHCCRAVQIFWPLYGFSTALHRAAFSSAAGRSLAFPDPHQKHPRMLSFIKRQISRQFFPRTLILCRTSFLFWGIWMVKDVNRAIFPFKACIWPGSGLPFELGNRVLAVSVKRELWRLLVNLLDLVLSLCELFDFHKRLQRCSGMSPKHWRALWR